MNENTQAVVFFFLILDFCFMRYFMLLQLNAICFLLCISFRSKCSTPLCFSLQKYKKEFNFQMMIIKWKFIHPHFLFLKTFVLADCGLKYTQVLCASIFHKRRNCTKMLVQAVWNGHLWCRFKIVFIYVFEFQTSLLTCKLIVFFYRQIENVE